MGFTDYIKKQEYPFGVIYYYDNYVIADLNEDAKVNTMVSKQILKDLHEFYKSTKVVYISNRQFLYDIDPSVYKLVNPKKLIGIAIVGNGPELRQRASSEQVLYEGSFSFFDNMDSAISWAKSFVRSASKS